MSWLKLWDEIVFDRPISLRGRPGSSTGSKSGNKGEEKSSVKMTSQGKKFEKRIEYQDPTTFSGFEVLLCSCEIHSNLFCNNIVINSLLLHTGT